MTAPPALAAAVAASVAAAASAAFGLLGADVKAPTGDPSAPVPAAGAAGATGIDPLLQGSVREGQRWQWPVTPRPAVVRPFVAPVSAYAAGHRGLDLAASEGTAALAVEAGLVVHAGVVAGRGTVSVEHADGLRSTYEPVTASVRVGDVVAAGDRLGTIGRASGAAHCGPTSCLHLGARRGEHYLDPLPLLAGGRVILLPFG
ncbi:MAG TPA: M23 family metallopeptidase [Ornithinibacter sp.]|nr:M23 family metallopeptidase [Ornithinibacter sp.]